MSITSADWLPPAIGLGVGVGEGVLRQKAPFKHAAGLYRLGVFAFGLVRELSASPGSQSATSIDLNYSLMTSALALEASAIPVALDGGGLSALGDVQPAQGDVHAHGKTCSTCASRKPIVAAPLLTPAASLRGYH